MPSRRRESGTTRTTTTRTRCTRPVVGETSADVVKTSGHCGVCRFTTRRSSWLTVTPVSPFMDAGCSCTASASSGCPSPMSPRRWVSHVSARTVGSPASTPKATPGSTTGPRGRTRCRRAPPDRSKLGSSLPGSSTAAARTGLAGELGVPARTVSRILRRHDLPRLCTLDPLTGEVIRSSKMTARRYERAHRASWSTWTSRRSAGSPTVAAGAHAAAKPPTRRTQEQPGRLRLRPLRRRRSQPARLQRDPRRRTRRHLRRVLRSGPRLLRRARHHRSNG